LRDIERAGLAHRSVRDTGKGVKVVQRQFAAFQAAPVMDVRRQVVFESVVLQEIERKPDFQGQQKEKGSC
jgi:hypothetical protein